MWPTPRAAAPDAPVIVKQRADSFLRTGLADALAARGVTELLLCGMMTHNCVTHTALAPAAQHYRVRVVPECCATVSPLLNAIALGALSDRVALVAAEQAL